MNTFTCPMISILAISLIGMGGCSNQEGKKAVTTSLKGSMQNEVDNEKGAGKAQQQQQLAKESDEKELETRSLTGLPEAEFKALESLAKLISPGQGLRFGRDLDLPGGPVVVLGINKVSEQVMKELTAFKQLKSLMFCCPVADAELQNLPRLEHLQELFLGGGPFGASKISDAGLKSLEALTGMKNLQLGDTRLVTQTGISSLRKSLPNCRIEGFTIP